MKTQAHHHFFRTACARATALLCGLSLLAPAPLWAQPQQPVPQPNDISPRSNRDQVVLNFVNADLESVVKAVGQATGKNFVIDPRVKGTVNLVTEQPVSRAQALETLGSVLRMQGYAMVESNGFTKVVPEADAKLQGSPTVIGAGSSRGDQVVTQVFRLNYESANNLVPVLRPMIAPNNTITAYPANNTLVITDYADNLRRLARIIAAVDAPASGEVELVPLKNAVASDAAVVLQKLLDPSAAGGAGGGASPGDATLRTTVVAEPRSNSLMIRASSRARVQQARQLIEKIDQPFARAGNIWVVPLKNADAVKLAATLRAIVAADSTFSSSTQPGGQAGGIGGAAGGAMQNTSLPQGGQYTGGSSSGYNRSSGSGSSGLGGGSGSNAFSASFAVNQQPTTGGIIQADPSTNSLIITASEPVYRNLRGVIDDLDARRAQVYIESMIVEVTASQASELGIQWQGLVNSGGNTVGFAGTNYGSGGKNIINLTAAGLLYGENKTAGLAAIQNIVPDIGGLNLGVLNKAIGLGALLRALGSNDSVNLLSTPNLITLENEEAKILIGQNIPITTGSYAQTGSTATVSPFQTFDRKDVGITLRVRPQITEGGLVKMQIYQESSSVVASTVNATQGPTTNVRSIETNVMVDDGQIIVLGGLIEDSYGDGVQKVPLLGDIPFIGSLFRYENKNRKKTNLLVFLRPYVMRTAAATDRLTQDRYEYIRGQQQGFVSPNMVIRDQDTPVLPPADAPSTPFVDPRYNGPIQSPLPLDPTLPATPAPQPAPQSAPPSVPRPLSLDNESFLKNKAPQS
nr:type II secretion system secretin GspD [uncultured Cupriavidus sp.]